MTLTRKTYQLSKRLPYQITSLLAELGLRYNRGAGTLSKSFWIRQRHQLYEILHTVWKVYLARIVKCHPDRGGNEETCKRLNAVFRRIKMLFAKKGVTLGV